MKKYSILIVGLKCYSGHIREFIVNLKKKNPQAAITLVTASIRDEYRKDIEQSVDRLVMIKQYRKRLFIPLLAGLLNRVNYYWAFLKLYLGSHFDIIDIHFPNVSVKQAMPILRRMTHNIVMTPWGSDVMRVESGKDIYCLTEMYSQAKHVTVSKDSPTGKAIISKFNVAPEKMVELKWGGEFFDYIQEHATDITTEEAKARFSVDGKYVITCGYNMQYEQRQEDIINAVCTIKEQLPDNLLLLFPYTYAINAKHDKHKKEIVERCQSLGLDYKVVEENLDLADLLKLRMATDIFVHVQDTDAGSRCVMEYVFCNKKLVHGAWNKYPYLEDYKPSCYFPVNRMEDLESIILKASQTEISDLPQEVRKIILERGWNHKMTFWNEFFESLVKDK